MRTFILAKYVLCDSFSARSLEWVKRLSRKRNSFFSFFPYNTTLQKKNTMLSFVFAILFEINDQDHKTTYRVNSTTLVK